MKSYSILLISALVGVAGGLASQSPWLAGRWANLIVWGVAGIGLGLFANGWRAVLWSGIVYGVVLSITFLIAGFQGTADKLPAFLALTLALSVVGAIGGVVTVWIGSRLRQLFRPPR